MLNGSELAKFPPEFFVEAFHGLAPQKHTIDPFR